MHKLPNASAVICLMGPTAIGKTDLALKLTHYLPIEIISVDSAMVYHDLNIGTAKPDKHVLLQIPHHLVNILSPDQPYSAGQFCRDVWQKIAEIQGRHNIPLLVGGTMLYFKSLQQGIIDLPAICPSVRQNLSSELLQYGLDVLYQQLQQVDPHLAERLNLHDQQRILRGLEVYRGTGQSLSLWQKASTKQVFIDAANLIIWPHDREKLKLRINDRFIDMLNHGFIEEVQSIRQNYPLNAEMNAMKAVGYRQVWQYLEGEINYASLVSLGQAATRQLAKRQLTWLRTWPEGIGFVDNDPSLLSKLIATIQSFCGEA